MCRTVNRNGFSDAALMRKRAGLESLALLLIGDDFHEACGTADSVCPSPSLAAPLSRDTHEDFAETQEFTGVNDSFSSRVCPPN